MSQLSESHDSSLSYPDLGDVEALANDLKHLLVHAEQELIKGDARQNVEQLERWVESYRRGLAAAHKISGNGLEMLHKTRIQLKLALEELLRLEDEGGNPANREQSTQIEQLTGAVRRIDHLMPNIDKAFHSLGMETENA